MVDEITCIECGCEIDSNLSYCPNCKCNVELKKPNKNQKPSSKQKLFNHPIWGIAYIIIGIWAIVTGTEWYFYLLGVVLVVFGIHKLYITYKERKNNPEV